MILQPILYEWNLSHRKKLLLNELQTTLPHETKLDSLAITKILKSLLNECTLPKTMMNQFLWLANETTYLSMAYLHANQKSMPNQQQLKSCNSLGN